MSFSLCDNLNSLDKVGLHIFFNERVKFSDMQDPVNTMFTVVHGIVSCKLLSYYKPNSQ